MHYAGCDAERGTGEIPIKHVDLAGMEANLQLGADLFDSGREL